MLEEELERMAPDLGVIEEWKRKNASYVQRLADLETATAARNEVRPIPPACLLPEKLTGTQAMGILGIYTPEVLHGGSCTAADPPPCLGFFWPSSGLPAAL